MSAEKTNVGSVAVLGGSAVLAAGATLSSNSVALGVGVANTVAIAGYGTSSLAISSAAVTTTVGAATTVTTTSVVPGSATGLAATCGGEAQIGAMIGGVSLCVVGVPLALMGAYLIASSIHEEFSKPNKQ